MGAIILALTAMLVGEFDMGNYKACVYDKLGDTVIITIDSYKLCPMTIEV